MTTYSAKQVHDVRYPALSLTPFHQSSFLSGHTDGSISLWDVDLKHSLFTIPNAHANHVYSLVALSDSRFASGAWDDTVKIWDAESQTCLKTISLEMNSANALAFHPEGFLMMGFYDRAVVRYDLQSETSTIFGDPTTHHTEQVTSLCVLPNGSVMSASRDGTLKCWDAHSGRCVNTLSVGSPAFAVTVLSDSRLASGAWNDEIQIWDLQKIISGQKTQPMKILTGHEYSVRTLGNIDNKTWASGARDNTIKIWNDDQCQQTLVGHTNWVNSIIALSNGSLVSASEDASLRVWA